MEYRGSQSRIKGLPSLSLAVEPLLYLCMVPVQLVLDAVVGVHLLVPLHQHVDDDQGDDEDHALSIDSNKIL